ncbi:hypothetical protein AVEN_49987-1 [Araneus ventricosus]|uniref:DDE-1 domain-containing protein n=1 Tax=Araneus ventricosus TaxID=182803 RepID=A0A4Y2D2R7_ARAVE|nr:hypothetical protein AVEN_49987-1 [Araneus ventricosus]
MDMGIQVLVQIRIPQGNAQLSQRREALQNFLKCYNLKTAVWSAAKVWDGIPTATLKNAWNNLWPATIFYEDEENVDTDFKGFQI